MSDEPQCWSVSYAQSAIDFIFSEVASKNVAQKLFKYRELLGLFPDFGSNYEPSYKAATPPFPCRFIPVPDTPFTMYYVKNEEAQEVVIFCIEYQRADPNARFSSIDWTLADW